jgi:hypothetical protein
MQWFRYLTQVKGSLCLMRLLPLTALIASSLLTATALSGCTATVVVESAPEANDPGCAEIIVRLPDQVGDLSKRQTNAQSTGAWGNPTAVILRCGLEPVEISSLPCVTAGGVDWLVDESKAPSYRFITYAANPATEVIVDSAQISGVSALEGLGSAVSNIPAAKRCK